MCGIGTGPDVVGRHWLHPVGRAASPSEWQRRRHLPAALVAQAVVAAATLGYRRIITTDPDTGSALADHVDVALISLFIATYGAATVLLGTHLAAVGHGRRITRALHVAGACMLAAAVENVVEDGFKVDWLVGLWVLLIAVSWSCLLFAAGTLLTARGTRLLGLLLAAPPTAFVWDFSGLLTVAFVSGIGVAVIVTQERDRPTFDR